MSDALSGHVAPLWTDDTGPALVDDDGPDELLHLATVNRLTTALALVLRDHAQR